MRISTTAILTLVAVLTTGCGGIVGSCSKAAITASGSTAKVGAGAAARTGAEGMAAFGGTAAERAGLGAVESRGIGTTTSPFKPELEAWRPRAHGAADEPGWAERAMAEATKKALEEMAKEGLRATGHRDQPAKGR